MPTLKRLLASLALTLAVLAAPLALNAAPALASHSQVALFEEDDLLQQNPAGTMAALRSLGVGEVRVYVEWSSVAPAPTSTTKPNFDSANPAAYHWGKLGTIIGSALQNHIAVDLLLAGGAPRWADGPGIPPEAASLGRHLTWRPNAAEYGNFVHAVLLQYGRYVHNWEIFNEPNFGEDLGPQTTNHARVAEGPAIYRSLVDAAWRQFASTGHGRDTISIGQVTARGMSGGGLPGSFGQMKPLIFVRDLYCVGTNLRPLTRGAAASAGCPTNRAGSRAFARQHPGLFKASGFGIHPYPQGLPPNRDSSRDPNYITFNTIPRLETTLDRIDRAYHARGRMSLYNNEYGFVTRPPNRNPIFASPTAAAGYMNQAEYMSWIDPRIKSTMQYLLLDPPSNGPSQFFSGLDFQNGAPKPGLAAYRMPLWLPHPVTRRGRGTEVWGAVRPAHAFGGRQVAQIQWRAGGAGAFQTVAGIPIRDSHGYFDVHVRFPRSGQVQVIWNEPGIGVVASRIAPVTIR